MDPLSIIAGVTGAAAATLHFSKRLYELIDSIVNGPQELIAMRRDTREFFDILAGLEPIMREKGINEDRDVFDVVQRLKGPLDNCMVTLKELEILIQKSVKPTGELKKSRWRTFASTFREKELRALGEQLASGKLTLGLALTTINTIRSARIQKDTSGISSQIAELRVDLKNNDNDKVQLASVAGRKGSEYGTDFGFALGRFLENVSVMERPPSQSSVHSGSIEGVTDAPDHSSSTVAPGSPGMEHEIAKTKKPVQKTDKVEFHSVNTTVYDARSLVPNIYIPIESTPLIATSTIDDSAGETTSLNLAARQGNVKLVEQLLKDHTPAAVDERGSTPVHEAAAHGQLGVLKVLLAEKTDLETTDNHGLTALHKAANVASTRQVATIALLIDHGAKLDSTDDLGATALHYAAWKGCDEAVLNLLQQGADVTVKDNSGWTPLHLAAYQGNKKTAELLLDPAYGSIVDARLPNDTTALMWAAEKGHEDMVKLLLTSGAKPDLTGWHETTALHHATANGFTTIISLLIQNGADIESQNSHLAHPLHVAAQYGQSEAAEKLLEFGADPDSKTNTGWPPLHQAASRGHTNVISVLLKKQWSADIEVRGEYNKTALIWAGEIGQAGSIGLLIAHGADLNAQDQFGETSLHYASANGFADVVRILASNGANVRVPNSRSMHPLHIAASYHGGVYPVSKVLLDHGAEVNAQDEDEQTALHYAAVSGNKRLVHLLLDRGADPRVRNSDGKTAVDLARAKAYAGLVKVLEAVGAAADTQV